MTSTKSVGRFVLLLLLVLAARASRGQDPRGDWQGTLRTGGNRRLVLHISKDGPAWGAMLYALDQQLPLGYPTTGVSVHDSSFVCRVDQLRLSIEAMVSADGATLTGTLTQNGAVFPIVFTHATTATAWSLPDPDWGHKRIEIDPRILGRYVGHYAATDVGADAVWGVVDDGGHLYLVQRPGREPHQVELFPASATTFFARFPTIEVTFVSDSSSVVNAIRLHSPNPRQPDTMARRVSDATSSGAPEPESATRAVLRAFQTHDVVMLGEMHGNKQEYAWLRSLVANADFGDRVDDIVMEFGNSLYQDVVDRYVRGDSIPLADVQRAWLNTGASVGPPSPVIASLYQAVRESNMRRRGKHQVRILCGEPPLEWSTMHSRADLSARPGRDAYYARVVKTEVLSKHQRALLIMGSLHFIRNMVPGPSMIERELRQAGTIPYVIISGTNVAGAYNDLEHRFDAWPAPAVVALGEDWVGHLPANSVMSGGERTLPTPVLKNAADALLYLGPRDSLTRLLFPRAELDGTAYGAEIERRMRVAGRTPEDIAAALRGETRTEAPQFARP